MTRKAEDKLEGDEAVQRSQLTLSLEKPDQPENPGSSFSTHMAAHNCL